MVILHVTVNAGDAGGVGDQFLVESRCTEQTGRVLLQVAELYALRLHLRELLALHAQPPADVLQLLSDAGVRTKQLLVRDALVGHVERLRAEVLAQGGTPPEPPPADDVCAGLTFAKRQLPADATPLSDIFKTTNEKSRLTLALQPGASGRARPLAGEAAQRALAAAAAAPAAVEVSLLAFVSARADGGGGGRKRSAAEAGGGRGGDDGAGDEERPRLSAEQIERLCASRKVCAALRSEALQKALASIDGAAHPERALDLALATDEHLAAFVHEMLVEAGIRESEAGEGPGP
mmetsp:Transcript_3154/g.7769  ORF Transcript_3154/g.7769 Transcript_3154/m.7769 type:complete len:292 (-) Transcript_3154:333-1208(-)